MPQLPFVACRTELEAIFPDPAPPAAPAKASPTGGGFDESFGDDDAEGAAADDDNAASVDIPSKSDEEPNGETAIAQPRIENIQWSVPKHTFPRLVRFNYWTLYGWHLSAVLQVRLLGAGHPAYPYTASIIEGLVTAVGGLSERFAAQ